MPGGFGKRGIEGKIAAIRYARENKVPYLGICLGMQVAVDRVRAQRRRARRREQHRVRSRDAASGDRADHRMAGPRRASREAQRRSSDLGGTMRLGAQECMLQSGHAGARHLRRGTHRRAPPPPLRSQQPLSCRVSKRRAARIGRIAKSRACCEMIELADGRIRGSSAASSTRNSLRRRARPSAVQRVRPRCIAGARTRTSRFRRSAQAAEYRVTDVEAVRTRSSPHSSAIAGSKSVRAKRGRAQCGAALQVRRHT